MADFDPVKLESFVRQRAPEIARDIHAAAEKAHNEADLVAEVEKVLDKFAANFDVQLHLDRERTLINGRADAVYNRFVIEYEPPHSLHKVNTSRNNKHAIEQVQHYMGGLERLDRHRKERLAGVVLDGGFFIFVRFREDHWYIDDPLPVDTHSTETFIRYLLSLSTELALTPENLVRDFGENSNTARRVVPTLYEAVCTTKNKKVGVLFQQWQRQFREVSGYDPESGQLDPIKLGRLYAVKGGSIDLEKLFFAIHTYYASFIKILALQVGYYYLMPKMGSGLAAAADYPSDKLCKYLVDMERGGLFHQLGIRNFLEGDFFGWYLDIWGEALDTVLRRLIGDLANYSLVTLDVDPEETRDLLKQLYQNLMPRELRHALGEYYTPDWLAERLLNQLGYDGNPATRLLDPACGSGTFLVLAIKRVRAYAEEKMLPPASVLEKVLINLVGFDLNPLAVISARTNYLLALGDLLAHQKGDISIPIYLADSILTPTEGADLFSQNTFSFNTAVGRFNVPRSLVNSHYIDQLADLLEDSVHVRLPQYLFRERLLQAFPLKAPDDESEIGIAVSLYVQLLRLEEEGINGIWARIIKNAFAPLFQEKFDLVAGNPPWVNWESLPEDYRQDTIPLWAVHNLFQHKGFDAILGKAKDDISILMTYVALDQYVKKGGSLGFIITQSVFKTGGAGQGFRRFRLGDNTPLKVKAVDDMADLKPFEGAANRTAIIIIGKGTPTIYPVQYSKWYKPDGGSVIPEDLSLDEITRENIATYRHYVAQPVDDRNLFSPWFTGRPRSLRIIRKIIGESDYQARSGICTWLNGVYWIEIDKARPDGIVLISNLSDVGRVKIENVQTAIEPELLYPLARGRDVCKWAATPSAYILVPNKQNMGLKAIPEDELALCYPKTFNYLKHFETQLRRRSGYRRYFHKDAPFYSLFNIGEYTFSPYRVCWAREDVELRAAVVGNISALGSKKLIMPDQTLQFVSCNEISEAHYVCALLNSSISNYIALSYTSDITTRIMSAIPIKRFVTENPLHKQLSVLSQRAHSAAQANHTARVDEIESEIDNLAGELLGLTNDELKEIQESLEEMQ